MKQLWRSVCVGIIFWAPVVEAAWDNEASLGLNYRSGNTEKSLYKINIKSEKYTTDHDWLHSLYAEQGMTEALQTEGLVRFKSEYRFGLMHNPIMLRSWCKDCTMRFAG